MAVSRPEEQLDEEAFPDWARGAVSACIHWEESLHRDITNPDAGPDQPTQLRQVGRAEGWILVGEDMRYHILELTVTFEGQTFEWIRAGEGPGSGWLPGATGLRGVRC